MIVKEIIERLSATGSPFVLVEGANELAEVKDRPPQTPAAYVYVSSEASGPNQRMTGPVLQMMATDIAVVIIIENQGGRDKASEDVEAVKAFVRARLLGFKPASAADVVEHILGQVVQIKDSMVWFEDVFGTSVLLTEQP